MFIKNFKIHVIKCRIKTVIIANSDLIMFRIKSKNNLKHKYLDSSFVRLQHNTELYLNRVENLNTFMIIQFMWFGKI